MLKSYIRCYSLRETLYDNIPAIVPFFSMRFSIYSIFSITYQSQSVKLTHAIMLLLLYLIAWTLFLYHLLEKKSI